MSADELKKDWVQELVCIMRRLRAKDGCPWDLKQTHQTLKKHLIEESYELLEAIDEGDDKKMASELGDVLLQVIFHCRIAEEEGRFDLQVVARSCAEMLIRRHPHIFGDIQGIRSPEAVKEQWEKIKAQEAQHVHRTSALDGVPRHLPALMHADKLQDKARRVGFDWKTVDGPIEKVREELEEVIEALDGGDPAEVFDELGDLLFATVNLCRLAGHDPESALRGSCTKFTERFIAMEKEAREEGIDLRSLEQSALEKRWQRAKALCR